MNKTHLDLAVNTVHIHETHYKGKRMFVLAPDDDLEWEITQSLRNSTEPIVQLLKNIIQSPDNSELESRVKVLEQKLETIVEALEKLSGPDEIRNPDGASGARFGVYRFAQYRKSDYVEESKDCKKSGGPDEIRTHDPRRVKAMS